MAQDVDGPRFALIDPDDPQNIRDKLQYQSIYLWLGRRIDFEKAYKCTNMNMRKSGDI